MPFPTEFSHWPKHLESGAFFDRERYQVSLTVEQKAFLKQLFPGEFIKEIADRYSFDPNTTLIRRALFAATNSFLRNSRIRHQRKTGQIREAQKHREEKLRAIDEFIELFDIEPDYEAWPVSPPENPTLLKLERLVLNAMEHQDTDRALSEVWNFRKRLSTLREDIAEMRVIAEHYATSDKSPTRGRPINVSDFRFVATLAHFWNEDLNRSVTLDTYKGEGLTETFRFIRDCAMPINHLDKKEFGKISNSQITTMIRKYRTEKPAWEKSLQKFDVPLPF